MRRAAATAAIGATSCGWGVDFPGKHGTTRTELCSAWSEALATVDNDETMAAAQIRAGSMLVTGGDDLDLVNEYIDYVTDEC